MGNLTKESRGYKVLQIVVGIVSIAVTVIGIIVTVISIWQTARKNRHQKSNRHSTKL
ncbi:MAG: hypothetical protein IJT96_02450 [Lachnospiraceae bacterium]|nr:hypothetical protein [Lachnospiraceae bacterium]